MKAGLTSIIESNYVMVYIIGVGAAWNTANVHDGSTIAVFGLGAVGLAVSCDIILYTTNMYILCIWLLFTALL